MASNSKKATSEKKVEEVVKTEEPVVKKASVDTKGKVVNCGLLNVRKEPNLKSEVLTIISSNDVVTIIPESLIEGWHKVKIKKITGYVASEYIEII